MAFRFPFARKQEPSAPTPAPPPEPAPRAIGPRPRTFLQVVGHTLHMGLETLDDWLCWFAIPFGATLANSRKRYGTLLAVFAGIFVLGAMPLGIVSLLALGVGYLGVLAIGRAWVRNEKIRVRIVKKLQDDDPDLMPDLRGSALVSALQLLILFPLLFMQLQRQFELFHVAETPTFFSWMWFAIDKTYLKALPDWSILYGVHISGIEFDKPWGKHLVLLSRLTFDWILIQGTLRIWAIRTTIAEGVAAIRSDPDMAVRLGRRAIPTLVEKLSDPDSAIRGAAANALVRLGDKESIQRISEALAE